MARRYVRDNRGRFASVGATARGGRLRTAAGNKRATQTQQIKGASPSGTIGKPKGLKPGTIKAKPQVSSTRQAATDRLKIKTQAKRAIKADRGSVVAPGQRSRLESGKGATIAGSRIKSTVAKPRTQGNEPSKVAKRIDRKAGAVQARLDSMTGYGKTVQQSTYQRQIKSANTLKRAQDFVKTGKLPGRDNSIKAQRELRAAKDRLNAKRIARQRGDIASTNVPMAGARGKALDREISRNVAAQKTAARAADKTRNRQFKSDQSRAKELRSKYGDQLAKDFAAKRGMKASEVKSLIKGMEPSAQIKLLTQAGRQQRAAANIQRLKNQPLKPGQRRLTQSQVRRQLRADTAAEIYGASGAKRNQIIRNQARLARTERARGNQMRTRAQRVAEAQRTGLPLVRVTQPKKSEYDKALARIAKASTRRRK